MKTKLLFLASLIAWASFAFAEDVDIYGVSNIAVKPNVLIILDNSGSMAREDVYEAPYSAEYDGDYTNDAVYVEDTVWVSEGEVCRTETVRQCGNEWVDGHYEEVCEDRWVCTGDWSWGQYCHKGDWEQQQVCSNRWVEGYWEEVCEDVEQEICEEQGHYETGWTLFFADINSTSPRWKDDTSKNNLLRDGYCSDRLYKEGDGDVNDTNNGTTKRYRLGNYLNYLASMDEGEYQGEEVGEYRSRMEIAKEVVAKLITDNFSNVNFGLMAFNEDSASDYYEEGPYSDYYGNGGYIVAECGASLTTLIGDYDPETDAMADSAQPDYGAVGLLKSDTNTPLAETLAEAGLYFAGKQSLFNSANDNYPVGHYSHNCTDNNTSCMTYISPIDYRCQRNYVILVTDGAPTQDDDKIDDVNYIINEKLTEATDGNTSYLDDIAEFLRKNDLSNKGETGDFEYQTITTYTIGVTNEVDASLLNSTASRGGGKYHEASNAAELNEALNTIITAIEEQNEVFTAAAVPVSRANKAYAGNFVYYGLFQPTNTGNWYGNLKKYAITDNGEIQDKNGNPVENGGTVDDYAVSFWSNLADGASVTAGGSGEILQNRITDRNIYTYTGTTSTLTHTSNLFATTNEALLNNTYTGLTAAVIDAVHKGVTDDWILGSLLHSQPMVVHYDTNNDGTVNQSMIYAGANDGMLHCFNDDNGEEMWGFIPQDLLDDLHRLTSPIGLEYFVDGTPVYYHYDDDDDEATSDKKLLIFGERRGGYHYTALDISNYNAPILKYSISPDILGSDQEQLGQSWAIPQALEMADTTGSTKDVFLMAGGYDTNQDALPTDASPPAATDAAGRAVYAVDARTGALFSNFGFSSDNYPAMTHSIIAVSGFENPKTTNTTRVYAGDMNGNLFAFRDDIFHRNTVKSLAANFNGLYDGREDGTWGQKLKLYSVTGRKIWYAPNIVNEYLPVDFTYPAGEINETEDVVVSSKRVGDYVFFGTGDRAHPERTDLLNGFYAIKNNWQWSGESPTIVEAYIDDAGNVKAKSDDHIIIKKTTEEDSWEEYTSELYILDVTDDLFQNAETDEEVSQAITDYVKNAINHKNNRGWFIRLEETDGNQVGEKVVSSPLIFNGVIYFSTYVPEDETEDADEDPCAVSGAGGNGYLYALGYKYGEAAINFDPENDDEDEDEVLKRTDRRKKLKSKGIPPQPVLVVHEGKPTIITGFETIDPIAPTGLERAFWRQLNK